MAQKRSCEDQLPNGVSSKHPRQMGEGDHKVSHLDLDSLKEASGKHYPLGEGGFMVTGLEGQGISADGKTPNFPDGNEEDNDAAVPRSLSLSPWAASSSEEDYTLDLVPPLPYSSEYFCFNRATNTRLQADDLYYSVVDYAAPRKSVPVGPDHQADIPELSESSSIRHENDDMAGRCVIPRIDWELPPYDSISSETGRTDCDCLDMGSVRCVRHHIMEAREKLMETLGQEAFVELGFCEMGEVVAEKWSKHEQQLFHKVVHCNPVSMDKNFWKVLSAIIPTRTKMEIVSYYFNVFMLRKRADQNRHDPRNIDSDNDEWQLSDDDGFDPGEKTDEDSAVESPVCHDNDDAYMSQFNNSSGHIGYPFEALSTHRDVISKFDSDSGIDLLEKRHNEDPAENSLHESSYASSDSGPPSQLLMENTDCSREWQDFILEPCDAKAWNRYSTCGKDEADFLPTCSMIQEVFGDGTLDSDIKSRARDPVPQCVISVEKETSSLKGASW